MILEPVERSGSVSLYRVAATPGVFIASTSESRQICNDPLVFGVEYTRRLSAACARVLRVLRPTLREHHTSVVHLLRGGLNFGLREALHDAYGWNGHGSSFLSAQRRRTVSDPEQWEITEAGYRKFHVCNGVDLVCGDVVASGTSLRHAVDTMLDGLLERGCELRSVLFFTIGGGRTEEVFQEAAERIAREHPGFLGTTIVYLEGRFPVAAHDTPLAIKFTGTDLLRQGDALAPEFQESQYESPMFPVERCTIYDAGSRAFEPRAYLEDVLEYWEQVEALQGRSFAEYAKERCPWLSAERFGHLSLKDVAGRQVERLRSTLRDWD